MAGLWWARRDLRLGDNAALVDALADGRGSAVFPWTPAIEAWSGRRRAHLARVLGSLAERTEGGLGVRRGAAAVTVLAAAREVGARVVTASEEFSPAGMREQADVAAALASDGRELRLAGSPYAVPPGEVAKADGSEYRVFTPYYRAWREGVGSPAPGAAPSRSLAPLTSDVDLQRESLRGDTEDPMEVPAEAGESLALVRLEGFLDRLAAYPVDRDRPDRAGTSGLSVALAFGEIHPRTILAATRTVPGDAARAFDRQLAWRDFHADTLLRNPSAQRESLSPVAPDDHWAAGPAAEANLAAWRDGRTGFPLVDAGMRELAATGTMHGRARMVAASFLVKDLHLPWQRGADHFRRTLLDYDHAQNQLNWQWVAGTGRDAAPFFRVFNPGRQAATFDPDGRYVSRWIDELGTPDYPAPMLDHATEREVALAAFRRRGLPGG